MTRSNMISSAPGALLHHPARYDAKVWLFTFGRSRAFYRRIAGLARLNKGDHVLDVGCGTGSLAIEARHQVGSGGAVQGIDPSDEMLAWAARKTGKAGLAIDFLNAAAQELPFPDAQFDVILSTLMLHHLGPKPRARCVREMRRVVKPKGRVLVVDFTASTRRSGGFLARFHRHGHVAAVDVVSLLIDAGLEIVETGAVGFGNLHFVLATAPVGA